jgi:thiamine-monophosphate kinase
MRFSPVTDPSHRLQALAEVRAIDALAGRFRRHPDQLNAPHQADAELVRLTALGPDLYLAATIDGITSEITGGFYKDLYTAGWVLVQANLSDLAAVGAAATGLLLALSLQPGSETNDRLSQGIADALDQSGVPVLGGDLNDSAIPHLTACAIGLVTGRPVTRTGIRPGDRIWATGPLGSGNALAIVRMLGLPDALFPEESYRPTARLAIGQAARPFARAMMDTSDGPMSTLDHLARLNGIGWDVAFDLEHLLDPKALAALTGTGAPLWPLFCGEHGEYELMIAVNPGDEERLREIAPLARPVATASKEPGIRLYRPDGSIVPFDGSFIRNLAERAGTDWKRYAAEFQAFGERLGLR